MIKLTSLGVLFAGWLFAPNAHASPCQTDSDCPARFTCTTIGQTACTTPTPCTGSNCPSSTPPCALKDIKACASQACRGDGDCPDDMICFTDGSSAPNCVPPYLLTCVRSSDCGDGFDCVAATTTQCSDGSRSCMSQHNNEHICALQKTTCSSASDCPTRFTCGDDPSTACDDEDGGAADASCGGASGKVCLPPYASIDFDYPGSQQGSYNPPVQSRFDNGPSHDHWACSVTAAHGGGGSNLAAAVGLVLGAALLVRRRRSRR